jgi:hypothetical protein
MSPMTVLDGRPARIAFTQLEVASARSPIVTPDDQSVNAHDIAHARHVLLARRPPRERGRPRLL